MLSLGLAGGGAVALVVQTSGRPSRDVALAAVLLSILLLVLASDLRERAVYPLIVYPGVAVVVIAGALAGLGMADALLGGAAGFALFAAIYALARVRYGASVLGDGISQARP